MVAAVDKAHTVTDAEALRDFARLLDRIAAGEEVVITRGGKAVARMGPAEQAMGEANRAALTRAHELREQLRADGVRVTTAEIIDWKNEGRP